MATHHQPRYWRKLLSILKGFDGTFRQLLGATVTIGVAQNFPFSGRGWALRLSAEH
jgi:hypothetical protein